MSTGDQLLKERVNPWSSFVESYEGLYLPNSQTSFDIVQLGLSKFIQFLNTTTYRLGRNEPSSPPTRDLHGLTVFSLTRRYLYLNLLR